MSSAATAGGGDPPRLRDDCFAHDPKRMPAAEALALLRARVSLAVGTETVPLGAAAGRILAADLVAGRDVPAFDNAAVDGYAFAHADLAAAGVTPLALAAGRAAAGHAFAGTPPGGAAVRVLTGAAMPAGTDTALMQEDVRLDGATVLIPPGVKPGANRRRAGEDMRAGQPVLRCGCRLRPQDLAAAAAQGCAELAVFRRLRVGLVSTGDELREPGQPLPAGATYDANRTLLAALLQGFGCAVTDLGIWPDRAAAVAAAMAEAAAAQDAIVTSGGASRGDEDHVVRSIEQLGRLHFWQIAVKPGRPLAFGRIGGCTFIGLPGNPVAAMICCLRFARPVLTALGGGAWPEPQAFPLPAAFALRKKPGRREYLRARLVAGPDGRPAVAKIAREGSGIITSLVEADGLVEVAEEVEAIAPGDAVDFVPFSELGIAP